MMVRAFDVATAGLRDATTRFESAAARTARPDGAGDVDAVVDQIAATHDVAANVAVVRTADEMVGTLLDIVA